MNPNGPRFLNVSEAMGLSIAGNYVCWVDLNRDGYPDLVAGDHVWWNDRGRGFVRGQEVGGCVAADFDNDGYPDLFSFTQMKLYRNVAGKRFEEVPLPPFPEMASCGACWVDFTGDGFVDLVIGGYGKDVPAHTRINPQTGRLEHVPFHVVSFPTLVLLNVKGERFRPGWGIHGLFTRGVTACDFNQSGRPSVYLSDYRLQPNWLLTFKGLGEVDNLAPGCNAVGTTAPYPGSQSIGSCWGGFGDKGLMDLFVANFAHQDPERGDQPKCRILRNLGVSRDSEFEDMGTCGVFYQESYASAAAGDYDNDGQLDFYLTTVYDIASFKRPNYPVLMWNAGSYKFLDATRGSGLEMLPPTYQAAWADFDNTGRLSLVTAGKLLRNQWADGHWIDVSLEGDGLAVNRSAIGAQVRIRLGDRILVRQVEAGAGQGNQNDLRLHFGLGQRGANVDLEVYWPNGATQTVASIRPDQIVQLQYRA